MPYDSLMFPRAINQMI